MPKWTVVDEFDKRLGAILDQYEKAIKDADDTLADLYIWFDENYDGQHDVTWPREE